MKLYYMPGACSLAANILLREAGAAFDLDKVGRDKVTGSGENYLTLNPKGYVPALKLDDGEIVTENLAIQGFIADSFPAAKLAPAHGTRERLRLDEMAVYVSTEIHKGYSPLFNPSLPDEVKASYKDRLIDRYKLIEQQLSDGRAYLMGDGLTTVDAYLFTVTRWSLSLKVDLSGFPNLQAYMKRMGERAIVKAAMESEGIKTA
jgi:glutathione S-transferase